LGFTFALALAAIVTGVLSGQTALELTRRLWSVPRVRFHTLQMNSGIKLDPKRLLEIDPPESRLHPLLRHEIHMDHLVGDTSRLSAGIGLEYKLGRIHV